MTATAQESIASLRLLVGIAKADGVLHDREREALESTLEGVELEGLDLAQLMSEDIDLDAQLGAIRSDEARRQAYASAYALANADGECSSEEEALLDRIRRTFGIDEQQARALERLLQTHEAAVVRGKTGAAPAFAGLERNAKIDSEVRKTAIVCALLGAFPVPLLAIATDLTIAALQVSLAKDIASFWGKEMETGEAKTLLAGFGVGTGARIAVTNLLKVFPVWGAAAGAAAAYASTYAVGRVVSSYFERGEGVEASELKAEFKKAQAEGKKAFQDDKAEIDQKAAAHRKTLEELAAKLEAGDIDQAEFERRAAALDV